MTDAVNFAISCLCTGSVFILVLWFLDEVLSHSQTEKRVFRCDKCHIAFIPPADKQSIHVAQCPICKRTVRRAKIHATGKRVQKQSSDAESRGNGIQR